MALVVTKRNIAMNWKVRHAPGLKQWVRHLTKWTRPEISTMMALNRRYTTLTPKNVWNTLHIPHETAVKIKKLNVIYLCYMW